MTAVLFLVLQALSETYEDFSLSLALAHSAEEREETVAALEYDCSYSILPDPTGVSSGRDRSANVAAAGGGAPGDGPGRKGGRGGGGGGGSGRHGGVVMLSEGHGPAGDVSMDAAAAATPAVKIEEGDKTLLVLGFSQF